MACRRSPVLCDVMNDVEARAMHERSKMSSNNSSV